MIDTPAAADAAILTEPAQTTHRPDYHLRCTKCRHEAAVPDDPAQSIYDCTECGTRTAFGVEMPRIANVPHDDKRFVVSQISHSQANIQLTLDRAYARDFAIDLLSVCEPNFRTLMAGLALAEGKTMAHENTAVPRVVDTVDEAPPAICACGKPSALKNGACLACADLALSGTETTSP